MNIGIDSEKISRFRLEKLENYKNKFLSNSEVEYINTLDNRKKQTFIASRFSAKEAIFKAFGIGISSIKFREISILPNEFGKPIVTYDDYNIEVSITYCEDVVTTIAMIKEKE